MASIKHFAASDIAGKDTLVTIASGPVIIEDCKVVLDKHGDDTFWKFPGGTLQSGLSFEQNAIREVKEELGIDVELLTTTPLIVTFTRNMNGKTEQVILIHYLAKRLTKTITPGRDVREFCWADINKLPADCAPNIKPILDRIKARFK